MFPGLKNYYLNVAAKGFPQMSFAAELLPAGLIEVTGHLRNLMEIKGQQRQQKKIKTKIRLSMTIIMFVNIR